MIITKATATVETVESENPNGEFDVILSTNALDRDGDNLNPDEWKTPLPDHITFDSDHGMSVATTVGSGKPFINDDGQLQVRGTFASTPHAQNVRTLVNEGHIKTTSVAFMERKGKKDTKPERELLNGAFVAVPANAEAIVLSSKAASPAEAPGEGAEPAEGSAADELDEQKMAQAIHDAACHLGAVCSASNVAKALKTAGDRSLPGVDDSITSTIKGGSPQESAEESAAAAVKAATPEVTAESTAGTEESAESVALRARALAFLLKANTSKETEQ